MFKVKQYTELCMGENCWVTIYKICLWYIHWSKYNEIVVDVTSILYHIHQIFWFILCYN